MQDHVRVSKGRQISTKRPNFREFLIQKIMFTSDDVISVTFGKVISLDL